MDEKIIKDMAEVLEKHRKVFERLARYEAYELGFEEAKRLSMQAVYETDADPTGRCEDAIRSIVMPPDILQEDQDPTSSNTHENAPGSQSDDELIGEGHEEEELS